MIILRACVWVAMAEFLWAVTVLTKDDSPHTGRIHHYPLGGVFYSTWHRASGRSHLYSPSIHHGGARKVTIHGMPVSSRRLAFHCFNLPCGWKVRLQCIAVRKECALQTHSRILQRTPTHSYALPHFLLLKGTHSKRTPWTSLTNQNSCTPNALLKLRVF